MNTPSTLPAELGAVLSFNAEGLIVATVQDADSGDLLMQAWMNREALAATLDQGVAVFWSRSRQRLWKKGESSQMVLKVEALLTDCDGDSLLLKVRFTTAGGAACHTGRRSCFYRQWQGDGWREVLPVIAPPQTLYGAP